MRVPGSRRLWIILAAVVLVVGGVALAVLPIVVRHVALAQLAKLTPRAVVLDGVELNLFTRHLALKGFTLAQKDSPEPALTFERVDVRWAVLPLVLGRVRITELSVLAPTVRVTRLGPATFDFADLLPPRAEAPREPAKPSRWTVTLDHLAVRNLTVVARDRVVAPPAEWRLAGLSFEASHLTTRTDAGSGSLTFAARINGSPFKIEASGLELATGAVTARVTLDGFPLASVAPYVPPTVGALPSAGTLTLALTAALPRDGAPVVSGDVALDGIEIVKRNGGARIVSVPRLAVALKRAELAARAVTLASVEIERPALAVTRAADGGIDLLRLVASDTPPAGAPPASTPTAAPPAAAVPPAAAAPPLRVTVERFALGDGEVVLTDEAVAPVTTLRLARLSVGVRDLTWPPAGPAAVELTTGLPGAGRVSVKGNVTPMPLDADVTVSLRGGSITPYGAYFPFKGRFAGAFNADARWRVRLADGALTAASRGGSSSIDGLAVYDSDAPANAPPLVRSERLRLDNIDFVWPKYARVTRVTITRPDARIERAKDGTLSISRVFAVPGPSGPAAPPAPAKPAPAPTGPAARAEPKPLPIDLDVGAIVIEQGFVRFADQTVEPAFSEVVSGLAVSLEGLSSTPGRRAKLGAQAVVGGNAALDIKGELAPLGKMYADIALELRDFALPTVTPYVDGLIGWKVANGKLLAKLHYTLDGDALQAQNGVTVADLNVAPSDDAERAQKRLGLPLSLVVALIKDGEGRIVLNVPIAGSLSDPKFDLSDAIWTAIRNVIVNIVAAPFRAIGRMFTSADNKIEGLAVDPVVFEAGSAVLTPAMEQHVLRVAAFLKGAPAVTLGLASMATPRDAASLKTQALTARLQDLQRTRKLKDYAAAVSADFRARFPEVKTVPPTDEAFARLLEGEPAPDARVAEVRTQRLQAVRAALTGAGGVAPARLSDAEPGFDEAGESRVDLKIGS